MELIKKALLGYLPILRAVFTVLTVLVLLGLISVVITYPLWWVAVNQSGIFTIVSLSLLGAALLWGLIISPVLKKRGTSKEKLKKVFSALVVVVVSGAFLLGAYGLFLLFIRGYYLLFAPLLLCYLLFLGNYLYGKKHS